MSTESINPSHPPSLETLSSMSWREGPLDQPPEELRQRNWKRQGSNLDSVQSLGPSESKAAKRSNNHTCDDPPDYHEERNIIKLRKQLLRQRHTAHSDSSSQDHKSRIDTSVHRRNAQHAYHREESIRNYAPDSSTLSPRRRDVILSASVNVNPSIRLSSATNQIKIRTPPRRKKQSVPMPTRRRAQSPHPTETLEERAKDHRRQKRNSRSAEAPSRQIDVPNTVIYARNGEESCGKRVSPVSTCTGCEPIISPSASPLPHVNVPGDGSDPQFVERPTAVATVAPSVANPPSSQVVDLDSSESAEQLRRLIEAMQDEFARLRCSKIAAEARAEKLQADLISMQKEMEAIKQLRSDAEGRDIMPKDESFGAHRAENEDRWLKARLATTSRANEFVDSESFVLSETHKSDNRYDPNPAFNECGAKLTSAECPIVATLHDLTM